MVKKAMSVSVDRPENDVVVVKISGEIGLTALMGADGAHSGVRGDNELDEQLRSAIPTAAKRVIVDLTDATYLSSMGIGTLVRLKNRVATDGDFRVVATGALVTLLKYGRLDQLFKIYPTVSQAFAE